MKDSKYVLIVFNNPMSAMSFNDPAETKILKIVATGDVRGASCGAMNFCTFTSDQTKEEIARQFSAEDIDFMIFEEKDSVSRIPNYLAQTFGIEPTEKSPSRGRKGKPEKLSLEDQLKEAIEKEHWEIAAKIRDKIEKEKKSGKKESKKPASKVKSFFDKL